MQIDGDVLIGYTDWERQKWHDWLGHHSEALRTHAIFAVAGCSQRFIARAERNTRRRKKQAASSGGGVGFMQFAASLVVQRSWCSSLLLQ